MPLIGNYPVNEAAAWGQGLGQSLGQMFLQRPQQRQENAFRQQQLDMERQHYNTLANQNAGLMQYRNDYNDIRRQHDDDWATAQRNSLDQKAQFNAVMEAVQQLRAGAYQQNANTRQAQEQFNQIKPISVNGGYMDWSPPHSVEPLRPGEQGPMPQEGFQVPGGLQFHPTQRTFAPQNQNAAVANQIHAARLLGQLGQTNGLVERINSLFPQQNPQQPLGGVPSLSSAYNQTNTGASNQFRITQMGQ